jgi:hypothetical protein
MRRKLLVMAAVVLGLGGLGGLYAGGSFDWHLLALGLNATECWSAPDGAHKVLCGQEAEVLKAEAVAAAKAKKEAEAKAKADAQAEADRIESAQLEADAASRQMQEWGDE